MTEWNESTDEKIGKALEPPNPAPGQLEEPAGEPLVGPSAELLQVQAQPEDDEELLLYATDPKGVNSAMGEMKDWFTRKLELVKQELAEAEEMLAITRKAKWGMRQAEKLVKAAANRVVFYEKVIAALDAGYLVVPSMPMRNIMVRRRQEKPTRFEDRERWRNRQQEPTANLPAGEGANRNPDPIVYSKTVDGGTDKEGKQVWLKYYHAHDYKQIVFPLEIAKPKVLERTAAAAALKVFDEIGIVEDTARGHHRRGDPIIIGRIRNPRPRRPDLSFFIAWAARLDRV